MQDAIHQIYVFTDSDDPTLQQRLHVNHVINTNCSTGHGHKALCCKMASEFNAYIKTDKSWFCHVDDDNYLNIPNLLGLLQRHNSTEDCYLGKPSLKRKMEVLHGKAFWFATGSAGFCISRALANKMTSRKLLRIKVTPDLHLIYSTNGGNLGLVLKMKNIVCLSFLLTKHVKYTYLYLFKFVLYSIVAFKAN